MDQPEDSKATCWTLIKSASAGSEEGREVFASRYLEIVRMYLANRWQGTSMIAELDDSIQATAIFCRQNRFDHLLLQAEI